MVSYSAGDTLKVQLVPPLLSLTPRPNKNLRRSASTQGLGLHAPALNAAQASKQARENAARHVPQILRVFLASLQNVLFPFCWYFACFLFVHCSRSQATTTRHMCEAPFFLTQKNKSCDQIFACYLMVKNPNIVHTSAKLKM